MFRNISYCIYIVNIKCIFLCRFTLVIALYRFIKIVKIYNIQIRLYGMFFVKEKYCKIATFYNYNRTDDFYYLRYLRYTCKI